MKLLNEFGGQGRLLCVGSTDWFLCGLNGKGVAVSVDVSVFRSWAEEGSSEDEQAASAQDKQLLETSWQKGDVW